MTNLRSMPEGFAEYAASHNRRELQAHYNCGTGAVNRWYAEAGIKLPRADRATQTKLATSTVRALVLQCKSASQIAEQYGVSKKVVISFVKRNNLGPWQSKRGNVDRTIPDDFRELAPTMIQKDCIRHYKCGRETIVKWYQQTGIVPLQYQLPKSATAPVVVQPIRTKPFKAWGVPLTAPEPYRRDMSDVGQAVDFLRRYGPVSRANGDTWRRGNTILTSDEIIERATWKGWKKVGSIY